MSNKGATLPNLITYGATLGEVVVFTSNKTKLKEVVTDCHTLMKKHPNSIGMINIRGKRFFILPTDTMDDLKERFMKTFKGG